MSGCECIYPEPIALIGHDGFLRGGSEQRKKDTALLTQNQVIENKAEATKEAQQIWHRERKALEIIIEEKEQERQQLIRQKSTLQFEKDEAEKKRKKAEDEKAKAVAEKATAEAKNQEYEKNDNSSAPISTPSRFGANALVKFINDGVSFFRCSLSRNPLSENGAQQPLLRA